MATIIEFEKKKSAYIDKAIELCDGGEYVKALTELKYLDGKELTASEREDKLFIRGRIFYEMGNHVFAANTFIEILTLGGDKVTCYYYLHVILRDMGYFAASTNYLMKLYELEPQMAEELVYESEEERTYGYDNFKIAYVNGLKPLDVKEIKRLIATDRIDEAIEEILPHSISDKNGVSAFNQLAVCYLIKNDRKKAKEVIDKVLQYDKDNITAQCNLVTTAFYDNNEEEYHQALEKLLKIETEDVFDTMRIASVLCECSLDKEALPYLEAVVAEANFDGVFLYFLGVCYFRLEEYKRARAVFVQMGKIDPDDILVESALRLVAKAERGEKKDLQYIPSMPPTELLAYVKDAEKLASDVKALDGLTLESVEELRLIRRIFKLNAYETQKRLIYALIQSECTIKREIISNVLIWNDGMELKKFIFHSLIISMAQGTFPFVADFELKNVQLIYPDGFEKFDKVFLEAYAEAFSTLILLSEEALPTLKKACEDAYVTRFNKGIKVQSVESLTLALLLKADDRLSENALFSLVGGTKRTTDKYLRELFTFEY